MGSADFNSVGGHVECLWWVRLPCAPARNLLNTFLKSYRQGLDVLTIKDLDRWENLEIIQRYTRSATFQDSLKLYSAIYSAIMD